MSEKLIVNIVLKGSIYKAFDKNGGDFTSQISTTTRKNAYNNNNDLERKTNKNGDIYWVQVPSKKSASSAKSSPKSSKNKPKKRSNSSRKILNYERAGFWSEPSWDVRYSDGFSERIKVRCPKCKGTGDSGYGNDTVIRPDAKRCPLCTSTFVRPEIYQRALFGNWKEEHKAKQEQYVKDKRLNRDMAIDFIILCFAMFILDGSISGDVGIFTNLAICWFVGRIFYNLFA